MVIADEFPLFETGNKLVHLTHVCSHFLFSHIKSHVSCCTNIVLTIWPSHTPVLSTITVKTHPNCPARLKPPSLYFVPEARTRQMFPNPQEMHSQPNPLSLSPFFHTHLLINTSWNCTLQTSSPLDLFFSSSPICPSKPRMTNQSKFATIEQDSLSHAFIQATWPLLSCVPMKWVALASLRAKTLLRTNKFTRSLLAFKIQLWTNKVCMCQRLSWWKGWEVTLVFGFRLRSKANNIGRQAD